MSFIGDFQIRFPRRGAAFEPSPAFQRHGRRNLDLPVAERRLSEDFQEQREQTPLSHREIVRRLRMSTVAPRLWMTIARTRRLWSLRIKCNKWRPRVLAGKRLARSLPARTRAHRLGATCCI